MVNKVRVWLWKKRWQRRGRRIGDGLVFILGILLLFVMGLLHFCDGSPATEHKIDSYKGVAVYDNHALTGEKKRSIAPDGYDYGQKWQCVEYVKRFYDQVKNHRMPDASGHAASFFDPLVEQGQMNSQRELIQYKNGGGEKPLPDDLMVFTQTTLGHVAIVTEVTSDDIEVIEQNVVGRSRKRFSLKVLEGRYYVGDTCGPVGWLRKE